MLNNTSICKKFQIDDKNYYIECKINENEVHTAVHDFQRCWANSFTLAAVMGRVKILNKRIQYNEETVRTTILEETPLEANWDEVNVDAGKGVDSDDNDDDEERILKLKYRICNRPFHIDWRLKRQQNDELQETLYKPILKSISIMNKQIDELIQIIEKKDLEILQYKTEGAVLKRDTVCTKKFDLKKFHAKYADHNANLKRISALLPDVSQVSEMPKATENNEIKTVKMEHNGTNFEKRTKDTCDLSKKKESPRKRKYDADFRHMARKLKAEQSRNLQYENSQELSQELI